ncbi:MAG: hypothetical protein GXO37_05565 [Chloroflexi bacterium]|nr:hypothetical protein [Chloroflexota bacterium]
MLTLRARLQAEDRTFWRLVSEAWGLEPPRLNLDDLTAALLDADRVYALWQSLPGEAQAALAALQRQGGKMLWAVFVRRYGPLRDLSPAQQEELAPHRHPQSPAEWLWYRALVGRAFFETPQGLLEYAYVPSDLALLLPLPPAPTSKVQTTALGRPAAASRAAHPQPARPLRTLQVWTRALAWVRDGRAWQALPLPRAWAVAPRWLQSLWAALGLVDRGGRVQGSAARAWLTAPAPQAWFAAYRAWRDAPQVNDLRALPHLRFEGPWQNDPVAARQRLLAWLRALPPGQWWDLDAFVAAVREHEPHFQRPAPDDFDSWYIRRASDGAYLRGLEAWDEVDGALVRFWLTGPAHWLGLLDLARAEPEGAATAFRLTPAAEALLADRPPREDALPAEDARPRWQGRGKLQVPWTTPRADHYHIARLAEPGPGDDAGLTYRLTGASLRAARAQGLRGAQVARWLAAHVDDWPPAATQAVTRVFHGARAARLRRAWVLHLPSAEALAALRRSPARVYIVEVLAPTVVVVRPEGRTVVLDTLWDLGYLAEDPSPTDA